MSKLVGRASKVLATCSLALIVVACGTPPKTPASVSGLKLAVDPAASTACGLSNADQVKIDKTTESAARANVWARPPRGTAQRCIARRKQERK